MRSTVVCLVVSLVCFSCVFKFKSLLCYEPVFVVALSMMPRRRDRNAASLPPLPDSLDACRSLSSDVLALHLDHHHLSHSGSRSARGARLWAHTQPDSHDDEGESEIEGHGDDHS